MKKNIKILVIDDEENVLKSVRKVILSKFHDFEIELVSTSTQCLKHITQMHFDLLITDLIMPEINGTDLIKKIRQINGQIKIIVITGNATMKTYTESNQAGADIFIPKPFTRKELLKAINLLF